MTGEKTPTTPGTTRTPGIPGATGNPGATSTAGAPGTPGTPGKRSASRSRHEAWQPRVLKDSPLNEFENEAARSPDSRAPSSTIRDPEVDTAPLQGERDISDDDSLSNEYTPNQDDPGGASDTPLNNRGTQT